MDSRSLSAHARAWDVVQTIFAEDKDLGKTCSDALAAKLTRASDESLSDKSKISQLSAIVRAGRNCIRELAQREERLKCSVFAHLSEHVEHQQAAPSGELHSDNCRALVGMRAFEPVVQRPDPHLLHVGAQCGSCDLQVLFSAWQVSAAHTRGTVLNIRRLLVYCSVVTSCALQEHQHVPTAHIRRVSAAAHTAKLQLCSGSAARTCQRPLQALV